MEKIKRFLTLFFTWWNGTTPGTMFYTWRKGLQVGRDQVGNRYYHTRNDQHRWVIYDGATEPTRISSGWYGWLHHLSDELPKENLLAWEKPHKRNSTGTVEAYRRSTSILLKAPERPTTDYYQSWNPVIRNGDKR